MKKLIAILAVICALPVYAQPYGNEWIEDYSQKYLAIKIVEDGIYRIDYATLNANISGAVGNLPNIDPQNFQIFGRGEEQYIYVHQENDIVAFNSGTGFIEFYARKNDGWLDERIYDAPANHTNPYYSLFNDTAVYYLTWNNSTTNRRLTDVSYSQQGATGQYFIKEEVQVWNTQYNIGARDAEGVSDPEYTAGEGWFSREFGHPFSTDTVRRQLLTSNTYVGINAPQAVVEVAFTGISNAFTPPGDFNHHVNVALKDVDLPTSFNPISLGNVTYNGYELRRENYAFQPTLLGTNSTYFILKTDENILPFNPATDKSIGTYVALRYPHTYNLGGLSKLLMEIPASTTSTYINATNFAGGASYIYNLTDHKRIETNPAATGGNIQATIPNGGVKECYLSTDASIQPITTNNLTAINSNGTFTDFGSLDLNDAFVMVSHPALMSSANQYKSYRESSGFQVLLADINELSHQFAYGVGQHPHSIRGFSDFLLDTWSSEPQHLFLLGKSVISSQNRKNTANYASNLVPTMGYPPSDNLLTAGLNGTLYEAAIPTGRLSAQNNNQVLDYLNKVQKLESQKNIPYTLADKEWMKKVLHFGGGNDQPEQGIFRDYLGTYESIMEDTSFGGEVTTYLKTSTQPVEESTSDSIRTLIKNGVAMMNFFGHAGGNTFDISIDDAQDWNNQDRYPLIVANSCFSGDIHQPTSLSLSTSEEYVLIPGEGAIGFIATPDLSYAKNLHTYTTNFIRSLAQLGYGQSISHAMQAAVKAVQSPTLKATCIEMTLHGDPAIQLYTHEKPDFVLDNNRWFTIPSNITTDIDSFDLGIIVTNIGKGLRRNVGIEVVRQFPTNSADSTYLRSINGITFKDTVIMRFPVDAINGVGENILNINIDLPIPFIDEIDNITNNQLSIRILISSNDLFPIFPYNYAVVPNQTVTLKASTGDPLAPNANYIVQVDTTDLFSTVLNNASLETSISQSGGVIEWTPDLSQLAISDSSVFFWRTSPDVTPKKWREFSFQYLQNQRGWGQDHFFQFKEDPLQFMQHNRSTREFAYTPVSSELTASTKGNGTSLVDFFETEYRLDGELQDWGVCGGAPGIYVAVLDSLTFEPWGIRKIRGTGDTLNPTHNFGNANDGGGCRPWDPNRVDFFFTFNVNQPSQMNALADMLTNGVPDGNYILAYTALRGVFQNSSFWQSQHFQAFTDLGASEITTVGDSIPYIFFCRKGDPANAIEVVGNDPFEKIKLDTLLTSSTNFGSITSTTIGPAKSWELMRWRQTPLEVNSTDSANLELIGVRFDNSEELITTLPMGTVEVSNLGSLVDAVEFPYLKLRMNTWDEGNQTPPQLDRWHVIFEGVPEAALNQTAAFQFHADTLEEGDELSFAIAVTNVSNYDMDSLRITYWVEDKQRITTNIDYEDQAPLLAGQTLLDTIVFDSRNLSGRYFFNMEVNPKDSLWQLEQFHFNNSLSKTFYVENDNTNPLLDVTFDGMHILDGDIVSPRPQVTIELKDENQFLALDDTADFDVFLTDPNNAESRISFINNGEEIMRFTPAQLPKNKALIELQPTFDLDGTYRLRVQARDASKNLSGDLDYHISFEVINRSTITDVLNYPNPFTTSTRFVFTLTGATVPDYFKIQILTISGKVVREITQDELGPIHIGRNISQYDWNGTDEYGDRLANGVYLYRVITKISGDNIEHRSTEADKFFRKGFGKMYLMR